MNADAKSLETLQNAIKRAVDRCNGDVAAIAKASQEAYRNSLEPGHVLPAFGPYDTPTEGGQEERRARVEEAVAEVRGIIDAAHADLMERSSEPASADAVATVQLAIGRKGITGAELQALYDRHKESRHLALTILEAARERGEFLEHEPIVYGDAEGAKAYAGGLRGKYDAGIMSDAQAAYYAACIADIYARDPATDAMTPDELPPVTVTPEAARLGASLGTF